MKRLICFMLFSTASVFANAASFECQLASTAIEKMICADDQLSELDSALAQSYGMAKSKAASGDHVKAEQKEWLSVVRNKCRDAECLRQAYAARIATLDETTPAADDKTAPVAPVEIQSAQPPKPDPSDGAPTETAMPAASPAKIADETPAPESTATNNNSPLVASAPAPATLTGNSVMGEVVRTLFMAALLVIIAGLIRPSIFAKIISPLSRKKILGVGVVCLVVLGSLANLTKTPEQIAEDQAAKKSRDAEIAAKRVEQEKAAAPAAATSTNASVGKCIDAALDVGYVDGMCAYSYINTCVTTGSRDEMRQMLAITKITDGRVNVRGCNSMPTRYVNQFNAAYARRDKF